MQVEIAESELNKINRDKREALVKVLAEDPRPSYQKSDETRVYGLCFAGYEVKFKVVGEVLKVANITTVVE